jgi:hypothetical protein
MPPESVQPSRKVDFSAFVPDMVAALNAVSERYLDAFDIHAAFSYWVAELFETVHSSSFTFTDGANDQSIDFAVHALQNYSIYQCKCPEVATLESLGRVPTFDASSVNELIEAVSFMTDPCGQYKVKAAVRDVRSAYQQDLMADPESTRLDATLAVLGDLTPQAKARLDAERVTWYERGVNLNLVTWRDIYDRVHAMSDGFYDDVTFDLHVRDMDADVLKQVNWVFALCYAKDLVAAMEEYGPRLFDLNVRQEIPNSAVNKEIAKTVQHSRGRKVFHHLNNGLLITANSFAKKPPDRIRVSGGQVVNGCQTVSSLYQAYRALPPREQALFGEETRIQVKVIQNVDPDLLEQVVIATNNQNPMKARNLHSNSPEQKSIQRGFRDLGWFYVRKDGEYQSLCAAGKRAAWFRQADYKAALPIGAKARYKVVDNLAVAKAWYAWSGNSHSVLSGGQDYFGSEYLYDRLFKKTPSESALAAFCDSDFQGLSKAALDERSPSPHQYLLATAVAAFIRSSSSSSYANKRAALLRGLEKGHLRGNRETGSVTSSAAEQAAWLAKDTDYVFTNYLINMEDVLVELFSFTLARRYGLLSALTCRNILALPDVSSWVASGFHLAPDELRAAYPDGIVWRTAEFVRWAARNYCAQNKFQIDAAPRAKMYFAKRDTVIAMRESLADSNVLSREAVFAWKAGAVDFLSTLPAVEVDA